MSPINSFISHSFATATTFPKIVRNGLVFHYDAGQQNSYTGTGITWRDLSGNSRNGTLTNGPTYSSANGGSILFDGTNDHTLVSGTITVTAATFFAFVRKDMTGANYNGIVFSRGNSGNVSGMNLRDPGPTLGYHWNDNEAPFNTLSFPNLTWCMCAMTVRSNLITGYLGTSTGVATQQISGTFNSSNLYKLQVGGDTDQSRYFKGNISVGMVYNRELTSLEIKNNFDALKGRYGI